jgi:hypothetical protein
MHQGGTTEKQRVIVSNGIKSGKNDVLPPGGYLSPSPGIPITTYMSPTDDDITSIVWRTLIMITQCHLPIQRARAAEAQCPKCKRWYSSEDDARRHHQRRHAGLPVPATFPRHPKPVKSAQRGRMRRQRQQQQQQQQQQHQQHQQQREGRGNWTASQVRMERAYWQEVTAIAE